MNPLFDRRAHEEVETALSQAAPSWRRSPSADLRERILSSVDANPRPASIPAAHRASNAHRLWLVAAAVVFIGWFAWQVSQPEAPRDPRRIVVVSAEQLVETARTELTAPSIVRSFDRPLVTEVGRMREDALRAVDFLVARVSLPVGTRARGD